MTLDTLDNEITLDFLKKHYISQQCSILGLSMMVGCSTTKIRNALVRYQIPRRSIREQANTIITKANLSAANNGRTVTSETRKKISKSCLLFWANPERSNELRKQFQRAQTER